MTRSEPMDEDRVSVEWQRGSSADIETPVVRQEPYVEMKLEHSTLDPDTIGDRFFPDAVPYELDGTSRVFYWRPAVSTLIAELHEWEILCATPHALTGIDSVPVDCPPLVTKRESTTTLVVEGTVGGNATVCHVSSYPTPAIAIHALSASTLELIVEGTKYSVSNGDRRRIPLENRYVEPVSQDSSPTTVTPELFVRYPGQRELHHPASQGNYRLFPSFGLDLTTVPNPLLVPTIADELDDSTLAEQVGLDLTQRPYPERVLWQAFAYTAFDPHAETVAELSQLDTGHIVLRSEQTKQGGG